MLEYTFLSLDSGLFVEYFAEDDFFAISAERLRIGTGDSSLEDRTPLLDSRDLYIMYMQIAAEQARLENMRLSQELHELKRG